MPRRGKACLGPLLAIGLLAGGCGGERPSASARPGHATANSSVATGCDGRGAPDYFVPGRRRLALLGCARLGVSTKVVEFSGSLSRIGGGLHLCVNPAYGGRGRRGFFIPAICKLAPPVPRFAIRDADQPRQGVRGYELVIWGTVAAATSEVVAESEAGRAKAAVFAVRAKVARAYGEGPFGLFVLELPLAAACGPVTVRADTSAAPERLRPRRELCRRA